MRISLFAWEIIFLVVASVGILSFIILKVCHFTKNRYYHSFIENELIDSKKKVNSKNDVYFTDNLTSRYIDKYVICKTSTDLFLRHLLFLRRYLHILYVYLKRLL